MIKLLKGSDIKTLEMIYALEYSEAARVRVNTLESYSTNIRFKITQLELSEINSALDKYNKEVFAPKYSECVLIFDTHGVGLGLNYPRYPIGIRVGIRHIDTTRPSEDNVKLQSNLKEALNNILSPFGLRAVFSFRVLPDESYGHNQPLILFAKHSEELIDNPDNLDKFSRLVESLYLRKNAWNILLVSKREVNKSFHKCIL